MATATTLPRMLTVAQAAALANISLRHCYFLVQKGDIPSVRLGGAIRIPSERLLELLAGESSP